MLSRALASLWARSSSIGPSPSHCAVTFFERLRGIGGACFACLLPVGIGNSLKARCQFIPHLAAWSRCAMVGDLGALQGRQTLRNNHKRPDLMRGVTAIPYGVCVGKPSNDGKREPTLGAGGRRFKSCLPDQYRPMKWVFVF